MQMSFQTAVSRFAKRHNCGHLILDLDRDCHWHTLCVYRPAISSIILVYCRGTALAASVVQEATPLVNTSMFRTVSSSPWHTLHTPRARHADPAYYIYIYMSLSCTYDFGNEWNSSKACSP